MLVEYLCGLLDIGHWTF